MSTTRLFFAVPVSVLALVAIQACTATGGAGDTIDDTPPADDSQATLPPTGNAPPQTDAGKPVPRPDGGGTDAGVDAGPPPPAPGTACAKLNEIFKKPCGACGTQEAVCLAGGDAGGGVVSAYGTCGGEVPGGCIPGTQETAACGNCGSRQRTCTTYCLWNQTACAGEKLPAANGCHKGSTNLSNAGCAANTYREQTCAASCLWGNFSATCQAPPSSGTLDVSDIDQGVVTGTYYMSAAQARARYSGTCPNLTSVSTTTDHPYVWVTIRNNTAKTATVSVYNSGPVGAPLIKTYMMAYNTGVEPTADADIKACTYGTGYSCPSGVTCGNSSYAGLTTTKALVIPPGASYGVLSESYYNVANTYNPVKPTEGLINLNVRTDKLE